MSTRQPVRKTRRPVPRPAIAPVVPLLAIADEPEVIAAAAAPASAVTPEDAAATPTSASQPASLVRDREAVVELHFVRISALLAKAERVAEAMLDGLLVKLQRREPAYPGELMHICRGLHVLAKCNAELSRSGRKTASLTEAQVEQLEARLRKAFALA